MKNFIRAVASAAFVLGIAVVASADVYSNVFFWSRGIGGDADGDGLFDKAELRDSVHPGFSTTCVLGGVAPVYTNEWAHLPYRGTTNFVKSIYLSHPVTITNEETGAGYGRSSAIRIPSAVIEPLINAEKPSYTVYLRFKPDLDQPHPTYSWILNMGNNGGATPRKRGLMIGFHGVTDVGYQYGEKYYYTNRLGSAHVMFGGAGWTVDSAHMRVGLGVWNDLIVSVDGTGEKGKISVLHSRDGYSWQFFDSYTNSSVNVWHTCYKEKADIDQSVYDLRPNGNMVLGSENHTGSVNSYTNHASINGNHWKSFRGQIQTLAFWTNALSEAEMREAIAYPRMDLWRVGLDNDAATEFYDATSGEPVDVEGDVWRVPALAAGESATFRFPLDGWGEATMNEFLRIKSTSSSSPATLKVAVNGTACDGAKSVVPGRSARWFVPVSILKANATNEVVVTRTDAGTGAFTVDSVRFGGSVQFGHLNGSADEFTMEGNYQNNVYDLIGANFFDANRAIFGGTDNVDSDGRKRFTNQIVRFSVPDDLMNRGDSYTLAYRVQSQPSQTLDVTLNGRTLVAGETADAVARTLDVPAAFLRPTNEVRFINSGVYEKGLYFGIDYFQFSVQKPAAGLFLILR